MEGARLVAGKDPFASDSEEEKVPKKGDATMVNLDDSDDEELPVAKASGPVFNPFEDDDDDEENGNKDKKKATTTPSTPASTGKPPVDLL